MDPIGAAADALDDETMEEATLADEGAAPMYEGGAPMYDDEAVEDTMLY